MSSTFPTLIESSFLRIHHAALGFLGDREVAKEAAQEAMMKAYAARDRYDPQQPFYPWMYRIVKNTCLDILARRRRRPQAALQVESLPSSAPSPLEGARQLEAHARLWSALETLSEAHREVINLRHFQDLSYAEIATILGVPEGTVMSRLYRARHALAREMMEGE